MRMRPSISCFAIGVRATVTCDTTPSLVMTCMVAFFVSLGHPPRGSPRSGSVTNPHSVAEVVLTP